jgi:hypothetical protein
VEADQLAEESQTYREFNFIEVDSNEEEVKEAAGLEDLLGQTTFLSHKLLLLPIPHCRLSDSRKQYEALPIPSQSSIEELEEYIGPDFSDHFMMWNLSERAYDSTLYSERVIDNVCRTPQPSSRSHFRYSQQMAVN